jgi:hypothetical protein
MAQRFRRGKSFQTGYFEIGNTNRVISNLLIESDTFERNGKYLESKDRREMAAKLATELKNKYSDELFDLDYSIPQTSGLYVKKSRRDVLK